MQKLLLRTVIFSCLIGGLLGLAVPAAWAHISIGQTRAFPPVESFRVIPTPTSEGTA